MANYVRADADPFTMERGQSNFSFDEAEDDETTNIYQLRAQIDF